MTLSIKFIGWFFMFVSGIALILGSTLFYTQYKSGRITAVYLNNRASQDIVLLVIWVIGMVSGMGVLGGYVWARWTMEYFCWTLAVLVVLAGAQRIYQLKKGQPDMSLRSLAYSVVGVILFAGPIVAVCVGTILSLRGEEAAQLLVR